MKIKQIWDTGDGGVIMDCEGAPVLGAWSKGMKIPYFSVKMTGDGIVSWDWDNRTSRTPSAIDVIEALDTISANCRSMKSVVRTWTNDCGASYAQMSKYVLGISSEGKLSSGSKNNGSDGTFPVAVYKRLAQELRLKFPDRLVHDPEAEIVVASV